MKKYLLIIFLFTLITSKLLGHGGEVLSWTTLNTYGIYDFNNSKFHQSIDLNSTFVILNAGVSYKNINYLESKMITGYAGIGIGNIVQLQAGYSNMGFSIRSRVDFLLGFASEKFAEKHPYLSLITFSVKAERYINNPTMKWDVGIGIGVSINNSWGFDAFKK